MPSNTFNTKNILSFYQNYKKTNTISPVADSEAVSQALPELIDLLGDTLEKFKNAHSPYSLFSRPINGLEQLLAALEKKLEDDHYDLNSTITLVDESRSLPHDPKDHTLLNIAAMYAPAPIVKYLLENGAMADNTTIHHAVRNPDMNNVVSELKLQGIDINSPNKKGQTALYKNKRKRSESGNEVVACLESHGARMTLWKNVQSQVENKIDALNDAATQLGTFIRVGGFTGC